MAGRLSKRRRGIGEQSSSQRYALVNPANVQLAVAREGCQPTFIAGRQLSIASCLLAATVLADSALEHHRGSFENRAMYAPLVASALNLLASGRAMVAREPRENRTREVVYMAAGFVGLIGAAFHMYNVCKRPGGLSWLNLFYGAPISAISGYAIDQSSRP